MKEKTKDQKSHETVPLNLSRQEDKTPKYLGMLIRSPLARFRAAARVTLALLRRLKRKKEKRKKKDDEICTLS